jgi:hypothetical protein
MSDHAAEVTQRLENTWTNWWTFSMWTGLVTVAATSLGTLAFFSLADALLHLSQPVLGVLFVAWAALTVTSIGMLFHRLLRFQRSLSATARRVELEFPEVGSHLINLVQLAHADGEGSAPASDPFRKAAVAQAAEAVAEIPFDRAAEKLSRWRRFLLCMQTPRDLTEASLALAAVLVFALVVGNTVRGWSNSTRRLMSPWSFVPATGSVKILKVTPGDTEVLVGSSLEIAAEIDNPKQSKYSATLYLRPDKGPETTVPMNADKQGRTFVAALPQVVGPLKYRVEVGDSQSERYKVDVYQRPSVTAVEVAYEYPAYLGKANVTVKQREADLEAPPMTKATLRVQSSTPIARGYLTVGTMKVPGQVEKDGQTLATELLISESTTFTINLLTEGEHADPEPRVNRIHVVADDPPTVQLVEPGPESTAASGATVPIVVRAADDNGLGQVRIEAVLGETDAADKAPEVVKTWTSFPDPNGATLTHPLVLTPSSYKAGGVVRVRAAARDRRDVQIGATHLAPQETVTPWHKIRLIAPETKTSSDLARLDDLRAEIAKIFQDQIQARVLTSGVPKAGSTDAAKKGSADVRDRQGTIQKASVKLVEKVGRTEDDERLTIKNVLNKLTFGDMLEAIRQAEALTQAAHVEDLPKPTSTLTATQDRIIDVLRRLLNEVRKDTAEKLAEMKKRADTQLPPDVQSKLRELKDKLDAFLKEQKKVIEATQDLAKKPVEDFTDKDEKALKALAAAEDDWSKFMADKHSDLSKLPEQDFSNPSLLEEMIAVQTELKMAKDALTKKTADIAVPLEQLGAEMAKEMTTNIEKWLPDTPDREKWSQEEPLTDDMKEAPMAELPKELEDIVGDLMEEEEDLFDEMEDATSSWADSLDKGAGWDAMDGPISNNSARGVTGNRLPNTSEIAGRSGEGRSGKSSGEFVGDEAVGKGGRKTPSRLTPDAFVKGQVKDTSKDPVGGATGGGKQSGVGGAGLQGPVPDRPEKTMARLATKQAELRNKAEGIDLKFKVLKYHHADLKALIGQMAGVENDLRGGLYKNALRRREVLVQSLDRVKMAAKGEYLIRKDATSNLPTDIQKEILGSMQEPNPAGWEELNRKYFERLGSGPSTTPGPARPAGEPGKITPAPEAARPAAAQATPDKPTPPAGQ